MKNFYNWMEDTYNEYVAAVMMALLICVAAFVVIVVCILTNGLVLLVIPAWMIWIFFRYVTRNKELDR